MKTLALEFSSAERTAAILDVNSQGTLECLAQTCESGLTTANAFAMIESALSEANLQREDIEQIAVGLGPGSYTGIRASIAIAQGWSLAAKIKLQGISSAEALIRRARREGFRGSLVIAFDAQRGEFHEATIDLDADQSAESPVFNQVDADLLQAREREGITIAGPGIARKLEAGKDLYPDAREVGLLALERRKWIEAEKLEPVYLRETGFVKAPAPRVIPPKGD